MGVRIGCSWVGVFICIGLELEFGLELDLSLIYTFAGGGFGVRLELG